MFQRAAFLQERKGGSQTITSEFYSVNTVCTRGHRAQKEEHLVFQGGISGINMRKRKTKARAVMGK